MGNVCRESCQLPLQPIRASEVMNTASATMHRAPSGSGIIWKVTLILIPVVTLGLLLWLRQLEVNALRQRTVSSYGAVPAFQLTNQNGQPFGSPQLAGKIWIADFIYTTCPGPCPMISSRMSELQKPLEKTDVHLVSFSVDPGKDTPAVLRSYAERLQAEPGRWDFLTGPNLQSTNFRMTALNLRSQTAATLREFPSTARGWCWSIDVVKSAATTMRPKRT